MGFAHTMLTMNDWLRSLTVLGGAFAGVVAATIGLAVLIVPDPTASAEAAGSTPPVAGATNAAPDPGDGVPRQIGGTLTMSGDREATFSVDREDTGGQYGLVGDDARIFFGEDPLTVVQMNAEGLSFFPDADECRVTPGELNAGIGVAGAHILCEEIADIRDNGVVTVEGTVGMAADLLGMRDHLPEDGGTVEAGDETWEFTEAVLFVGSRFFVAGAGSYSMQLVDEATGTVLGVDYDAQTHGLSLVHVARDGSEQAVPANACSFAVEEIGVVNPRVTLLEMSLECRELGVPGLGPVPVDGTVIVEQVELQQ